MLVGNRHGGCAIKPLFIQGPSITVRVVLAVVLSGALMVLDHREQLLDPVRQTLSAAVHPIRIIADLPASALAATTDLLRSRRELAAEIERLRDQQLRYEARLQKLDSLEVENIRLRNLLESSYEVGESVLIAELLRIDLDPYTHLIQIDKGAGAGVYAGQPVLDANGIIGQVDRVGTFSSSVRLLTDPSHALPVQVNRNGVRAIATGTGKLDSLELNGLPNNTDIREGDLLVSSGLGGRFPEGYPVARVTTVDINPGQPFAHVTADPTGAVNRIREVLLVRREDGRRLAAGETDRPVRADPAREDPNS